MWAIEVDERAAKILTFKLAGNGVICSTDITYYRERKLRMLNGCHTIITALGFLQGFDTVAQCMANDSFRSFVVKVLTSEIMPTVKGDDEDKRNFADHLVERFSNPFLKHKLLSITFQSTMKMKVRNVPIILRYYKLFNGPPIEMCKGFAAWIIFMKPVKKDGDVFFGERGGKLYPISDDSASWFFSVWKNPSVPEVVTQVCSNKLLWDHDLTTLPGFEQSVLQNVVEFLKR